MKYFLISLAIGVFLAILISIAEDSIRNSRCLVTNRNATVIVTIDGQKVIYDRRIEK